MNISYKKIIIGVTLTFISFFTFSQNVIVSGKVVDENMQPIAYANIYLLHSNNGGTTNIEGKFKFSAPNENSDDTLVISNIGYMEMRIPIVEYSGEKAIKLSQYIKTFDEIIVKEKKPDPFEVLFKAFENVANNFCDSSYNVSVFSRLFIKYDTAFVFYRKTLAEIETTKDNIWFSRGNIIADQIINSDKLPNNSNRLKGTHYEILTPTVDYARSYKKSPQKSDYLSKIDTVYYYGKDKIYVIDIWAKKMNVGNYNLSQTILDEVPNPYAMIFNPTMEKLGVDMAADKSYLVRFYINASENYTIIRKIMMSGSSNSGKIFSYIVSDFNAESDNSYPTRIVSYIMELNEKSDGTIRTFTSLNEIFCYNLITPATKEIYSDNSEDHSLYHKYVHALTENLREDQEDYNTWEDQIPFIATDSLQEFAFNQILNLKQMSTVDTKKKKHTRKRNRKKHPNKTKQ